MSFGILEEPFGNSFWEKAGNSLAGPTVGTLVKGGQAASRQDWEGVLKAVTPIQKTVRVATRAAKGEKQTIRTGGKDVDLTNFEAVMYALGFTPVKQSQYYDKQEAHRGENAFENASLVDRPEIYKKSSKEKQAEYKRDYYVGTTWKKKPKSSAGRIPR